ncbi:MAG: hypothetical protein KME21_01760 [Desmonostoc vinosum HA7617-LM4]|jgi:hypothetical protein|nr:hypothetical protein [Desmonostoc vinosum HA7617-LM4]
MLTTALDTSALDTAPELAIALLTHYSFDLSGYSANELVERWQTQYPINWLHLAVIEALYQGRYKGVSVQQILVFWQRRGQATYHFNMEFERLICSKFPESLTAVTPPAPASARKNPTFEKVTSLQLPPAKKSNTTPLQLVSAEQQISVNQPEVQQENKDNESVPKSSTSEELINSTPRQLASFVKQKLTINPPATFNQPTKLLPPAVNHPPIGQFTPEKCDRFESFTSKLKAISGDSDG